MSKVDRRTLSLACLSLGVLTRLGLISPAALISVLVALGLMVHSFSDRPLGPRVGRLGRVGLAVGLAATTLCYNGKLGRPVFAVAFGLLLAAIVLYSFVHRPVARAVAWVLAASATLGAVATNMLWGVATIDVFRFQQVSSAALLHGQNPYGPVVASPEVVHPGAYSLLRMHLPYGPVLPVLEAPFRLMGDVRMLHLLAGLVTSLAVLALAWRAGTLERSACLVMAFPLTVAMVVFSWVDVVSMAGLAGWLVLMRPHPRWAIVALFVALGVKPTTLVALVPILFWSVRARRQILAAGAAVALFVIPFAVATGFSAFAYDVLGVQVALNTRFDALTIDSFLNSVSLPVLPAACATLVVAVTAFLVLRRRPRDLGELLTGSAVLATASFLVAKWAYLNYYYIPAVLLLLAIAGDGLAVDAPELIRPPILLVRAADWLRGALSQHPVAQRLGGVGLHTGDEAGPAA